MSKHFIFQGPPGSEERNLSGKSHPFVRLPFSKAVATLSSLGGTILMLSGTIRVFHPVFGLMNGTICLETYSRDQT